VALASTSAVGSGDGEGSLAVYGALRSSDNAVTVIAINKTYGDLTETLNLANLKASGPAKVYRYSNANLAAIVPQANIPIVAPTSGTTSTLSSTFPAQSITMIVVPQ
jgi:O-glycosyl hydrolase